MLERDDGASFHSKKLAGTHMAKHGDIVEFSVIDFTKPHSKNSYLLSADSGHIALFLSSNLTQLAHSPKFADTRDRAYELAQLVAPILTRTCTASNGSQMFGPQHTTCMARSNPVCGPTILIPTWYGNRRQFRQSARHGQFQENVKSSKISQDMSSS
eukprot:scaffold12928_cov77-Attheya_sp.AAC.1